MIPTHKSTTEQVLRTPAKVRCHEKHVRRHRIELTLVCFIYLLKPRSRIVLTFLFVWMPFLHHEMDFSQTLQPSFFSLQLSNYARLAKKKITGNCKVTRKGTKLSSSILSECNSRWSLRTQQTENCDEQRANSHRKTLTKNYSLVAPKKISLLACG